MENLPSDKQYVSLAEIAKQIGIDRSNARKYALNAGFIFEKIRTPESRGQLTLALSKEEAEALLELRRSQGFGPTSLPAQNNEGFFYVIQLIPRLDPLRIKLGFAANVKIRLKAHQTAAPTAQLLKAWPCKREWEQTAITSITREGCQLIANEVFECDNLESIVNRAEAFFSIMPIIMLIDN